MMYVMKLIVFLFDEGFAHHSVAVITRQICPRRKRGVICLSPTSINKHKVNKGTFRLLHNVTYEQILCPKTAGNVQF